MTSQKKKLCLYKHFTQAPPPLPPHSRLSIELSAYNTHKADTPRSSCFERAANPQKRAKEIRKVIPKKTCPVSLTLNAIRHAESTGGINAKFYLNRYYVFSGWPDYNVQITFVHSELCSMLLWLECYLQRCSKFFPNLQKLVYYLSRHSQPLYDFYCGPPRCLRHGLNAISYL
jgi:hypothetical protein